MIRAVFFDVDGVLVHPWGFRDALVARHGITPEMTRDFFTSAFADCAVGRADLRDVLSPFAAKWDWNDTVDALIDLWFESENTPNPDVLEIASELRARGLACYVASTQERLRAQYLTEDMGFGRLFDALFFSHDIGASKPDPVFFRRAAEKVPYPRDELLLVDDSVANVESARTAGWEGLHYTSAAALRADLERLLDADSSFGKQGR